MTLPPNSPAPETLFPSPLASPRRMASTTMSSALVGQRVAVKASAARKVRSVKVR